MEYKTSNTDFFPTKQSMKYYFRFSRCYFLAYCLSDCSVCIVLMLSKSHKDEKDLITEAWHTGKKTVSHSGHLQPINFLILNRSGGSGFTVSRRVGVTVNPGISSKANCCTRVDNTAFISTMANLFPIHERGPEENGRNA